MYIFPEDIKKSYESLKVPMIIIEPLASGDYEPLAISDGFLDFHSLSRDYLKRFHNKWDNEIFFERIHPEEKDKLRAISMDFLEKKTDYDITFRIRMDDGYHLMHSIGYWQTMEDGTDLAFLVYHDVQKHKDMFVEIANKYKLFQRDEFYVDALTNLPNINYVNKNGDSKIQEIVARGKNPVVIYLDIDSMQSYNRRYELKRGDDLLILVANILTAEFPHGIVARIFSDHFREAS
ncbi:MAG: diguanylate cyclase [Butyrivibrio sp.]|nr:diguanylate cyclase [Butyrivibrio sp.]